MGFMDREYYRGDESYGSPLAMQNGTTWLIAAHVVGFVLTALGRDFFAACVLVPSAVLGGQVWRVLSYVFVSPLSDAWGLLWNMLFLWWFGRELESLYGTRNFVANYLIGAVIGGLAAVLLGRATGATDILIYGASPAILGMLVTYTLWYPRHRIYFFGLFPIEMRFLVLIYVGLDLLMFSQRSLAVVPAGARLAAAAWGAAVKIYGIRPMNWFSGVGTMFRRRPRLEVYDPREDEELERELDELLDKVREGGIDSLTPAEKKRLEICSRRLRARRGY